jgi:hypothetical protein
VSDSVQDGIQPLGSIGRAHIAVQAHGLGQHILVQEGETGQHLVRLLGGEPERLTVVEADGIRYWSLPHDSRVDELLRAAIEVLISIRYLHPAFVQLRLDLTDATP